VALVDGNYNGVYNEAFSVGSLSSPGTSSDLLAVDLNGDGRFTTSFAPPLFEVLPLPKILPADGGYYSIEAAADGSTLRMQRVEPKMGTFALSGAEAELLLLSESGYYALNTTATPCTLPVGKYALSQALLKKTDANGFVWSFPVSVLQTSGRAPEIAVAEGRTTTLELPAPTRARVKVEATAGFVYFEFTIEAQKGLNYSPAIRKEGKEVPAPKFEVTDKSGKVVLADAFQYG
jgi:hypothetical protein